MNGGLALFNSYALPSDFRIVNSVVLLYVFTSPAITMHIIILYL